MESKFANTQDSEREIKASAIAAHFRAIMKILGLDLNDDSLRDTPKRVGKMYVNELFSGLDPANAPKITTFKNKMKCNEMVTVAGIRTISVCEHHFVLIDGHTAVSYIPRSKIIGLSKLNRIVRYYSRRPQVQERLTKQIADALEKILGTKNVAVHIKAKHYCVIARGVEDTESDTTTTELRGVFKKPAVRSEFLRAATGR